MTRRLFWMAAAALLVACGGPDAPISTDGPGPSEDGGAVQAGTEGGTAGVNAQAPAVDTRPKAPPAPSVEVLAAKVGGFLEDWSGQEEAFVAAWETSFKKELGELSWFKKLSTKAYEGNGFRTIFSDGDAMRPNAKQLHAALGALPTHGLDPASFELEALDGHFAAIDVARAAWTVAVVPPQDEGDAQLWTALDTLRNTPGSTPEERVGVLKNAGLDDGDLPRLEAARARLKTIFEAKATLNQTLRLLDQQLLVRWFRYAHTMRLSKRAQPFFGRKTVGEDVTAVVKELGALFDATDFQELQPALDALVPAHPDYAALQAELVRYRGLAEEFPEHIELTKAARRFKRGSKGDGVAALQARLVQEGYLEGEADGAYGPSVEDAVRLYQQTHQLKETGKPDRQTVSSLNKPFAKRAKQIELSLRRHRESEIHQGEFPFQAGAVRAWVNIPAFEVKFFQDGVLARTHRVVVGNNRIETHEKTGTRGRFNRTRMFTSQMRTVVLNPTWRVPQRIKEQELDLELMEQPDYYEKNGYRVDVLDDGTEVVVQLPGPGNALGLVKFLFPNKFAIYMHDTGKKRLFGRTIRAYSHGCMRTQDPLDLARWILVEGEGLTDKRFDSILSSGEEYGIALKKRIPVTIDYMTVGIHESGRAMFYLDIYEYDKDYRAGITPYKMSPRGDITQAVILP